MAPKEHHFLIFRHCPRKTSESVRPLHSYLPKDVYKYVGADYIPWEALGDHWCLAGSEIIMGNTGEWMMDSGMIKPGAKIQWEIIADDVTRDFDTAYYLAAGIRDGLANLDDVESVGEETIVADKRFSRPIDSGICTKDYHFEDIRKDVESRLKHLPRPTLTFSEALKRLEEIGGQGPLGDLSKVLADSEPRLEDDENNINGAADLLAEVGELLLYTRAGDLDEPFIPDATKQDVFDMIQFQDWLWSVLHVGNIHDATKGAALVQAMLRVLSQGYYESPASPDEDYDTRVTIYVGHDFDLLRLATVLDARWILQEPYISGQDGAFVPAPPMSGVHAVRRFDDADEKDQVELSFVYHMYAEHEHTKHFVLNSTGILEHTPLIFQEQVESSFMNDKATFIDSQGSENAVHILQDHVLHVLSGYSSGAKQCFHDATHYWARRDAKKQAASVSTTSSPATVLPPSNLVPSVNDTTSLTDNTTLAGNRFTPEDASLAFSASDLKLAFGIGCLAGILLAYFPWYMLLRGSHCLFVKKSTVKAKLSVDTEDSSSSASSSNVAPFGSFDQQNDTEEMDKLLLA